MVWCGRVPTRAQLLLILPPMPCLTTHAFFLFNYCNSQHTHTHTYCREHPQPTLSIDLASTIQILSLNTCFLKACYTFTTNLAMKTFCRVPLNGNKWAENENVNSFHIGCLIFLWQAAGNIISYSGAETFHVSTICSVRVQTNCPHCWLTPTAEGDQWSEEHNSTDLLGFFLKHCPLWELAKGKRKYIRFIKLLGVYGLLYVLMAAHYMWSIIIIIIFFRYLFYFNYLKFQK